MRGIRRLGVVAGVDGVGPRWVAALLDDDDRVSWRVCETPALTELVAEVDVAGIDVPVGAVERGRRRADLAARERLAVARSSVFFLPPAPALRVAARDGWTTAGRVAAQEQSRHAGGSGISAQSWALVPKVLGVERVLLDLLDAEGPAALDRLVEVHPEVSFRGLADARGADTALRPLPRRSKRTAAGAAARLELVGRAFGVSAATLDDPVLDRVPLADVLDALAAAWSARRWRDRRTSVSPPVEHGREDAVAVTRPGTTLVARIVE